MKKFINKVLLKIMVKTLPAIKYYPFKWLAPGINKSVNWYMQKRFPMTSTQPAAPSQTPPPADQPKS